MNTQEVAVVVPIYRDYLAEDEQISLQSIVDVLGGYPLVWVKPASLSLDRVGKRYPQFREENFSDACFTYTHPSPPQAPAMKIAEKGKSRVCRADFFKISLAHILRISYLCTINCRHTVNRVLQFGC